LVLLYRTSGFCLSSNKPKKEKGIFKKGNGLIKNQVGMFFYQKAHEQMEAIPHHRISMGFLDRLLYGVIQSLFSFNKSDFFSLSVS